MNPFSIVSYVLSLVVLGSLALNPAAAQEPTDTDLKKGPSDGRPSDARKAAPGIPADRFDKLRALIKPKPGGYADIPWMTDLWEARKKAAAEGKPLLVWVGDGHPLGWT